jgi:hypothetical protein
VDTSFLKNFQKGGNHMIWLKGIVLGASLFAIGVFVFLFAALRMRGPLLAGPGQAYSIDIRTLASMTTQNFWFWVAGVACLLIGVAITASWPGKFSPVFWILVGLADVVPVTALGIFVALVRRLHQVAVR